MFETPAFADCERTKVNRPFADAAAGLQTAAMLAENRREPPHGAA